MSCITEEYINDKRYKKQEKIEDMKIMLTRYIW